MNDILVLAIIVCREQNKAETVVTAEIYFSSKGYHFYHR